MSKLLIKTKEELAALLNGREIGEEINLGEEDIAKQAGLVVVFGASDDLVEFRGAIHDEVGCFHGDDVFLLPAGPLAEHGYCECDFCGYDELKKKAKKIEAIFVGNGYDWSYKTDIPHATFEILENGAKYCRGLVISISDL